MRWSALQIRSLKRCRCLHTMSSRDQVSQGYVQRIGRGKSGLDVHLGNLGD